MWGREGGKTAEGDPKFFSLSVYVIYSKNSVFFSHMYENVCIDVE